VLARASDLASSIFVSFFPGKTPREVAEDEYTRAELAMQVNSSNSTAPTLFSLAISCHATRGHGSFSAGLLPKPIVPASLRLTLPAVPSTLKTSA
jgi:hypothetical protein